MKRQIGLAVVIAAVLLVSATVAVAAWLSFERTADSSFTAASASVRVDLGDAETVPLFTLVDMQPGDSATGCFRAEIDLTSTNPATVAKLYSGGVTGTGLGSYLLVTIQREDPDPASVALPGTIDCSEVTGALVTLTGPGETLADYATTTGSYAAGDSLGVLSANRRNTVDVKVTVILPLNAPVAAGGLNATTHWAVEDQ